MAEIISHDAFCEEEMRGYFQLWTAVLADAITLYRTGLARGFDDYTEQHLLRRRARRWLHSEETHPGSFEWVCLVLGLDAPRLRDNVNAYSKQNPVAPAPKRNKTGSMELAFQDD